MLSGFNRRSVENGRGGAGDIDPVVKTTTATLAVYETAVLADSAAGAFTITLAPVAASKGLIVTITQVGTDGGNITIQDQDDSYGWSDMTMTALADHVCLYSDGLVWHVLHDTTT
jgi:diaminopimelate epimerase